MVTVKKGLLVVSAIASLALPSSAIYARNGSDDSSGSSSGSAGAVDLRGDGSIDDNSTTDSSSTGVKLRGDGSVDDNSTSPSPAGNETLRGDGSVDDNPGIRQNRGRFETSVNASGTKLRGDGSVDDDGNASTVTTGLKLRGDGSVDDNSPNNDERRNGSEDGFSPLVQSMVNSATFLDFESGEELRHVARSLIKSDNEISDAKKQIESRGKFKTFLIGTDFKNVGKIRSEIANTSAQIEKLEKMIEKIPSSTPNRPSMSDVEELRTKQQELLNFVDVNEKTFSIFGWFVKLFNK